MGQKISEQLKHCLDANGCDKCTYAEEKTILSCRGLLQTAYDKIKHLEELEEQGLMKIFPCKVGCDVYWVNDWFYNGKIGLNHEWHISESKISRYFLREDGFYMKLKNGESIDVEDFGKTVFLTQAKAEEMLKRMEIENDSD